MNVDGVSAQGGAKLIVTLDGKPALSLDFPSTDPDDPRIMHKYDKGYALDVPAGAHTITVENTGTDWCYATYRLTNYLTVPNLRVLALSNAHSTLVWVQNRDHTWANVRNGSAAPACGRGSGERSYPRDLYHRALGYPHRPCRGHRAVSII